MMTDAKVTVLVRNGRDLIASFIGLYDLGWVPYVWKTLDFWLFCGIQ